MRLQPRPEDRGLRLDVFIAKKLENVSRSQIQLLNRAGAIRIEGRLDKSGYRIRGGETIEVDLRALEPRPMQPEQIPLQIHFEDADFAVIEKPAGVVVHPGAGVRTGTIVHALLHHFQNLSDLGGESRPGIVHRLDKNTSGLLVIAKNNRAHQRLSQAFQERLVEKQYLALVHGYLRAPQGIIDLSVGRHPVIRTKMAVLARGRAAWTGYRVIEQFRGFSFLELTIKTGRTHQIRVHLSSIGHPVVGDNIYGESHAKGFAQKYGRLDRYFLHAAVLRFPHPTTGAAMEFRSPLPDELQNVLDRIKS